LKESLRIHDSKTVEANIPLLKEAFLNLKTVELDPPIVIRYSPCRGERDMQKTISLDGAP
jgi:hypothetical protein